MIRRTHVTLEETVGEYVVSLHLPVGLSFDMSLQIVQSFAHAIEGMAREVVERAEAEKAALPDVAQPETTEEVAGA